LFLLQSGLNLVAWRFAQGTAWTLLPSFHDRGWGQDIILQAQGFRFVVWEGSDIGHDQILMQLKKSDPVFQIKQRSNHTKIRYWLGLQSFGPQDYYGIQMKPEEPIHVSISTYTQTVKQLCGLSWHWGWHRSLPGNTDRQCGSLRKSQPCSEDVAGIILTNQFQGVCFIWKLSWYYIHSE
jgi:hypothetical protein